MATRSYEQFCPVAESLDLLGERWTLLIARELLIEPQRFGSLEARLGGINPTLLSTRLRQLAAAGLVEQRELDGATHYALTDRGRELEGVVVALARFGLPLLGVPTDDRPMAPHLVPDGLRSMIRAEELPDHALTIGLDLADVGPHVLRIAPAGTPGRRLAAHQRVSASPGRSESTDVVLHTQMVVLLWLRRGDLDVATAVADGLLRAEGAAADVLTATRLYGFELRPTPHPRTGGVHAHMRD